MLNSFERLLLIRGVPIFTELRDDFLVRLASIMDEQSFAFRDRIEPCDCLVLTQKQLYEAIDETPGIALNIIRIFSRRIRELNQTIRDRDQELMLLRGQPDNGLENRGLENRRVR